MTSDSVGKLLSFLLEYDKKNGYYTNNLQAYIRAVFHVNIHVNEGATFRTAILNVFSGSLLDQILKLFSLDPISDNDLIVHSSYDSNKLEFELKIKLRDISYDEISQITILN